MSSPARPIDRLDVHTQAPATPARRKAAEIDVSSVLRLLPLICAIAVLWLSTRHYFGVVQDARFYAVEALRDLNPGRYANDLYFQFGSQGSFSLFSKLYRPLLEHFGLSAAGLGVAIAGQALWLFGLFYLARNLVGDRFLWLSAAIVIAMPSLYAPYFGYGEAFATPRPFAEGLTMLALALLRSRPLWTVTLLLLSAALHPLMTLPGMVAAFVYLALGRPIWWVLAPVGAVGALGLGWAGIEPFANLHRTLDPQWLSVVQLRSLQCLLTSWPPDTWLQVLNGLGWGAIGLFMLEGHQRRFLAAVFAAGLGGLVCTFIGGDLAHNVLVVELQPWRSMWLVMVVVRIFVPVIFFCFLVKRAANPFGLACLLSIGLVLVSSITKLVRLPFSADFGFLAFALAAVALAAIAAHVGWTDPSKRRFRQVLSGLVAVAVPLALLDWDGRSPWTKFLESEEPTPPALAAFLPQQATAYWENSTEMLWFKLRRSSYFSCDQGTGVVFHRETAMTYRERADSFWPLRTTDFTQTKSCSSLDKRPKPERTREGLQKFCRREKGLDELVLIAPIPGAQARIWKSPILFQDIHVADGIWSARSTDRFYAYSCADWR